SQFAQMGRIQLKEVGGPTSVEAGSVERDDAIVETALSENALLITADNGMKASAAAKNIFLLDL
ncbi:MAG: hypothetical protein ACREA0_07730, partial [bacterium]